MECKLFEIPYIDKLVHIKIKVDEPGYNQLSKLISFKPEMQEDTTISRLELSDVLPVVFECLEKFGLKLYDEFAFDNELCDAYTPPCNSKDSLYCSVDSKALILKYIEDGIEVYLLSGKKLSDIVLSDLKLESNSVPGSSFYTIKSEAVAKKLDEIIIENRKVEEN